MISKDILIYLAENAEKNTNEIASALHLANYLERKK